MNSANRWLIINAAATLAITVGLIVAAVVSGEVTFWAGGVGRGLAVALGVAALGLALVGLLRLRIADPGWTRAIAVFLGFLLALDGVDMLVAAATGTPLSYTPWGRGIVGTIVLVAVFLALIGLLRLAFRGGGGVLGVARTVIDEAIRLRIAVVFMVIIFLVLPLLPFTVGVTQPVRYRVQAFLGYGFVVTWVLLALMTIFLACWTLCSEVSDKQIFTIATKPIGRGRYLLGKWLGIVALDGALLTVAGLAIYGFTIFYLAQLPPHNLLDEVELNERVLVARVSASPHPLRPFDEVAVEKLKDLANTQPGAIEELGRSRATELGLTAAGPQKIMELGAEAAYAQVLDTLVKEWMSVGPLQSQTYVFDGLANAKHYGKWVQWRYKASTTKSVPDDQLKVVVSYNRRAEIVPLSIGSAQEVPVLAETIDENGRLALTVQHFNPTIQGVFDATISFRADEMKMLFQVGDFGPNFLRAMLALWIKLGFLAMLGLMAATFLSFPVACMLAILVFGGAIMSEYLLEAVGAFGSQSTGVVALLQGAMALVAWTIATTLGAWARYSPGPMITDGLLFSWNMVLGCLLWIGLVWTGLTGLLAWLIFRRRELARVQV